MANIQNNTRSFIFDETKTVTFWTKNKSGVSVNQIDCIIGNINPNKEVGSFSDVFTALTSSSTTSFLLEYQKEFIFKKISSDSFIIATYIRELSGYDKIYYRIGTFNGSIVNFQSQVIINREVWGETINVVVENNTAHIFYTDANSNQLFSYNTTSQSEKFFDVGNMGNTKLDISTFNGKIVVVGYNIFNNQYAYPLISIGTFNNNTFTIEDSRIAMYDLRLKIVNLLINNEPKNMPLTSVFFSETDSFFIVSSKKFTGGEGVPA